MQNVYFKLAKLDFCTFQEYNQPKKWHRYNSQFNYLTFIFCLGKFSTIFSNFGQFTGTFKQNFWPHYCNMAAMTK